MDLTSTAIWLESFLTFSTVGVATAPTVVVALATVIGTSTRCRGLPHDGERAATGLQRRGDDDVHCRLAVLVEHLGAGGVVDGEGAEELAAARTSTAVSLRSADVENASEDTFSFTCSPYP